MASNLSVVIYSIHFLICYQRMMLIHRPKWYRNVKGWLLCVVRPIGILQFPFNGVTTNKGHEGVRLVVGYHFGNMYQLSVIEPSQEAAFINIIWLRIYAVLAMIWGSPTIVVKRRVDQIETPANWVRAELILISHAAFKSTVDNTTLMW